MQNQQFQNIELTKEINILYELGLEEWEIEYIIYLRTKEEAGKKFSNKELLIQKKEKTNENQLRQRNFK